MIFKIDGIKKPLLAPAGRGFSNNTILKLILYDTGVEYMHDNNTS